MRPLSPSVISGSSAALAWKALNWLDRPADPIAVCQALGLASSGFDWLAFMLGLLTGIFVLLLVQFLCTLHWALRAWVASFAVPVAQSRPSKPLYKIL